MNKKIDSIMTRLMNKLKAKNKITLIVIVGIIGIVLILFSEIFKPDTKKPKTSIKELDVNTEEYKDQMQDELVNILSQIQGVGEVKVMVTIEGSTEYVFAEEENTKQDSSADKVSENYQNKYVIVDNGNTKEALVKKILKPKISGVIVVCEGGNSPSVSEKIYRAVSAVLDIPANKICVAKG